ncbi:MAG: short-chain dehydrogenase/reductase [Chloroflexi bacterium]|nr:short-chain dehydrogenase/reductase [Chloroflexota bacterium]
MINNRAVGVRAASRRHRRLDGQIALITGGGQGIGKAMSMAFANAGATVVIADICPEHGDAVMNIIVGQGGQALACATDVTSPDSVSALFAQLQEQFDRVDILVNNAGICPVTAFPEFSLEQWRRVFAVNVDGPLLTTQAAAAIMSRQEPHPIAARRGTIINVSSPAAEIGRPMFAAYGASKAALNSLSRTSAGVLGPRGIATTVLYPGSVLGPLWEELLPDLAVAEQRSAKEILAERSAGMPNGRFQKPTETARMALYIAAARGMELNGRLLWSEAHVADL